MKRMIEGIILLDKIQIKRQNVQAYHHFLQHYVDKFLFLPRYIYQSRLVTVVSYFHFDSKTPIHILLFSLSDGFLSG
jgi:hypothetical protein